MSQQETLILGIGNTLLADEGVGVRMLDYLASHHPRVAAHTLVDGGTLSFTLAMYLEQAERLVVLDAAELGEPPGSVQVFEGEDMDRFAGRARRSVHEVSLADLLSIAHLSGNIPQRRALVAIQPMTIDWGQQLSAPVRAALEPAAQAVAALLDRWDEQAADAVVPVEAPDEQPLRQAEAADA